MKTSTLLLVTILGGLILFQVNDFWRVKADVKSTISVDNVASGLEEVHPIARLESVRASDFKRLLQYFARVQNPANCAEAYYYFQPIHPFGLGSRITLSGHGFLVAMAMGFVWVPSLKFGEKYMNRKECTSPGFTCWFLKIHGCEEVAEKKRPIRCGRHGFAERARAIPENKADCHRTFTGQVFCSFGNWRAGHFLKRTKSFSGVKALHPELYKGSIEETLRAKAGLKGIYGSKFFMSAAIAYLTRPNHRLSKLVELMLNSIEPRLMPDDFPHTLSVHVRLARDKAKEEPGRRRVNQSQALATYAKAISDMVAESSASNHTKFHTVLVGSDSKFTYTMLPKLLAGVVNVSMVPMWFFSSELMEFVASAKGKFSVADALNNHKTMGKIKPPNSTHVPKKFVWDEGMALAAQMHLLSKMGGFIGMASSNAARLIDELRTARYIEGDVPPYTAYVGMAGYYTCNCEKYPRWEAYSDNALAYPYDTYAWKRPQSEVKIYPFTKGDWTRNLPFPKNLLPEVCPWRKERRTSDTKCKLKGPHDRPMYVASDCKKELNYHHWKHMPAHERIEWQNKNGFMT